MRVLFVGGSDVRFRLPIAACLAEMDIEVMLAGCDPSEQLAQAPQEFLRWDSAPRDLLTPGANSVKDLRRIVEDYVPDIVHVFDTVPGLLTSRANLNCPVVRTVPGRGRAYSPSDKSLKLIPYRFANSAYRGGVEQWVFQNTQDRDWFDKVGIVQRDRSTVILGSGVDLTSYLGSDPAAVRSRIRTELGIDEDAVVALLAARLVKQKGVDLFVAASLRVECANTVLILAGDFPSKRRGHALGAVQHLGHRDDIADVMAASDIVVLPTRYGEGLPRILLEGAASSLPLIATNAPGCGEVVIDRVTGLLVEPSVDGLAAAIAELTQNPGLRRELGAAGRVHVAAGFSVADVAAQYVHLYHKTLADVGGVA